MDLDVLLVTEQAHVVLDNELVLALAVLAFDGFHDASTLDEAFFLCVAVVAEECCLLHFRHNITVADNDTTQSYQLVDVFGSQLSDAEVLPQVEGSDLDKNIILLVVVAHVLLTTEVVHV